MKFFVSMIFVFSLMSCGRNAFIESESGGGVIITQPVTTEPEKECVNRTISLTPGNANQNSYSLPFDFPTTSVGVPTHREGTVDFVMNTQIVLPFDFREYNSLTDKIVGIKLKYKAYQFFNPDWYHRSQICHSINNYCSGDKVSIQDHLNHSANYDWQDENFSQLIDQVPMRYHSPHCAERNLDLEWDALNAIENHENLRLSDLPDDYSIIIADDHFVKSASLEITYCGTDTLM